MAEIADGGGVTALAEDRVMSSACDMSPTFHMKMEVYQSILARHAQGNPPELQAKIDSGQARFTD